MHSHMTAREGSTARKTPGYEMMLTILIAPSKPFRTCGESWRQEIVDKDWTTHPVPDSRSSQTSMTGEKKCEILCVPHRWTRKSTTRNAIEIGTVLLLTVGVATAIPATALEDEKGGRRQRRAEDTARRQRKQRTRRQRLQE